jgi:hypothetical protein
LQHRGDQTQRFSSSSPVGDPASHHVILGISPLRRCVHTDVVINGHLGVVRPDNGGQTLVVACHCQVEEKLPGGGHGVGEILSGKFCCGGLAGQFASAGAE